jgi:ferrous iron transport protein B
MPEKKKIIDLIELATSLKWQSGEGFHDKLVEGIYTDAGKIAAKVVKREGTESRLHLDQALDRIVTSRVFGFPIMILILSVVLWLTIEGANYPSAMLDGLLIGNIYPFLKSLAFDLGSPAWLSGLLIDGAYLAVAWVIAVMLPPMAIFFPLFTLLEDFGYLPRVAFNMDKVFRKAGAHGKQALTMSMGFGCNAAGVVATRIIDSPRERLIAIITNNFSLCNGRWPTQILIATIFIGALVPSAYSGITASLAVLGIAMLGIGFMFGVSWFLSRTLLRGEVTTFTLELPPYRPPRFWKTIYTSLIDRTLIVLWRAVIFALPAGLLIWLVSNIAIGGDSLAGWAISGLDGFGWLIGLNGVILLAFVLAIPANEIVIPTILMLTAQSLNLAGVGDGSGVMFEPESMSDTASLLTTGGWTLLTGINIMLFSLLHNPCSTTIYTIYKETQSRKWTIVATVLPVLLGFMVCFVTAQVYRILTG